MDQWYVTRGTVKKGPFTHTQLKSLAAKGKLRVTDTLQQNGTAEPIAAGRMPELFPLAASTSGRPECAPEGGGAHDPQAGVASAPAIEDVGKAGKRTWLIPVAAGLFAILAVGATVTALMLRPKPADVAAITEPDSEPDADPAEEPETPAREARRDAATGRKSPPAKNRPAPKKSPVPKRKDPPAKSRPDTSEADLDAIVELLCVRGATGEEQALRKAESNGILFSVFAELAEVKPTGDKTLYDLKWVERMNELAGSASPAVARAAKAASVVGVLHMQIVKLQLDADEALRKSVDRNAILNAWMGILDGIGESDSGLSQMVDQGMISQGQADAIRKARADRDMSNAASLAPLGKAMAQSYLTKEAVSRVRTQIAALNAEILETHVAPALRARAASKSDTAPISIHCGGGTRRRDGLSEAAFLTGSVTSDKPLTRVVLYIEQKAGFNTLVSAVYFPRLEPGASFRTIQSALVNIGLKSGKLERSRYSVWCDQFAAEGLSAEDLPFGEAMLEYVGSGLRPGAEFLSYRSDGGGNQILMEVTDFRRSGGEATVAARFTVTKGDANTVIAQTVYKGTAVAGAADRVPPEARLTLRAGNDELTLFVRCEANGQLPVLVRGSRLPSTSLAPAALVRKKEKEQAEFKAKVAEKTAVLDKARELALSGNRDEAEKTLRKFIAAETEERWVERAQRLLQMLDELVKAGKKRQEKPPAGNSPFGPKKPKN